MEVSEVGPNVLTPPSTPSRGVEARPSEVERRKQGTAPYNPQTFVATTGFWYDKEKSKKAKKMVVLAKNNPDMDLSLSISLSR